MASSWIFCFYFLSWQILNIYCQQPVPPPPEVTGSYRAIGELSQMYSFSDDKDSPKVPLQIAFEENYDDENKMSAFTVWEINANVTFIENLRIDQAWEYKEDSSCSVVTKKDWIDVDAPPSLTGYFTDNKIHFSVQMLLSLDKKYLKNATFNKESYRGIPADQWIYEIKGKEGDQNAVLTIYAYWSNKSWSSTSSEDSVPLGYEITKVITGEQPVIERKYVNVFAFVHGAVNKAVFEPKEGIYCEGDFKSEYPFPRFPQVNALSIRSEIALAQYLEIKEIDMFYDMKNKLLRLDMDLIVDQDPEYMSAARKMTSEFTLQELGIVFSYKIYKGKLTCSTETLTGFKMGVMDLINQHLDPKYWDLHHFFGVNATQYRYIGRTVKRNIPCHIFQGFRNDWPMPNTGSETIWEWCLATNLTEKDDVVVFRDGELPIVSLKIHLLNSLDEDFRNGSAIVYNFYDVVAEDPEVLYSTTFDITRCFNNQQKRRLQFTVDATINDTNIHTFENATSDPTFIKLWRDQISQVTKLTIGSLRIAKVRSTIYNKIMYVMFTLLEIHPDIPNSRQYKSLANAEKDLKTAIDGGKLNIKYIPEPKKSLDLRAKPQTLVPQVDPTKIDHNRTTPQPPITVTGTATTPTGTGKKTAPTVTGTATTPTGTGKKTAPTVTGTATAPTGTGTATTPTGTGTNTSPTEPNIDKPEKKDGPSGHSPGTVAAVCITMLVVGLSLGAGGTFYKYRGLPQFCRR